LHNGPKNVYCPLFAVSFSSFSAKNIKKVPIAWNIAFLEIVIGAVPGNKFFTFYDSIFAIPLFIKLSTYFYPETT